MTLPDIHPDEAALLAALCADPLDATPRLVYADWVQEFPWPRRAARSAAAFADGLRATVRRTWSPDVGHHWWCTRVLGTAAETARLKPGYHMWKTALPERVRLYPTSLVSQWPAILLLLNRAPVAAASWPATAPVNDGGRGNPVWTWGSGPYLPDWLRHAVRGVTYARAAHAKEHVSRLTIDRLRAEAGLPPVAWPAAPGVPAGA